MLRVRGAGLCHGPWPRLTTVERANRRSARHAPFVISPDGCVQIRPIWHLFGRRIRPRMPGERAYAPHLVGSSASVLAGRRPARAGETQSLRGCGRRLRRGLSARRTTAPYELAPGGPYPYAAAALTLTRRSFGLTPPSRGADRSRVPAQTESPLRGPRRVRGSRTLPRWELGQARR